MHRLHRLLKLTLISSLVVIQAFFYPSMALAETSELDGQAAANPVDSTSQSTESTATSTQASETEEPTSETATTTSTTTGPTDPVGPQEPTGPQDPVGPQEPTGVTAPTGSDSTTYHLNPETGMWENDYYIWNPTTQQATLKTPHVYSYNPSTGLWETTDWVYAPEAGAGQFKPVTVTVAQPPAGAALGNQGSITNTGPSSNNQLSFGGTGNSTIDLYYGAVITNHLKSEAQSGNVLVQNNTTAGNALTGDAEAIANILNLLQSSWGTLGSDSISTFVANVDGDVVGDLYIDPSQIGGSGNTNLDVNVAQSGQINNDVDLAAQSGDASASNNTSTGDATTGDARAVANLMNLINSAITANRSFVGVLNINGNLNGDILLPEGLLQSIIASTGPNSNNQINDQDNNSLNVGVDTNRSIINDVTADAGSGNAVLSNNTSAGDATSGSADTNITLLNLTGQKVVTKNALLVFVNVFGKWVGLIMNAPSGSNAVAATGPGSNNTIDSSSNTDADINVSENSQINNNVHTAAHSGDASLTNNTLAGDARSGDAFAGANILNMIDSTFDVSDWFGVLFINVFGSWIGSFGVNTAAGNPVPQASGGNSTSNSTTASPAGGGGGQVFNFVAHTGNGVSGSSDNASAAAGGSGDNSNTAAPASAVLPAQTTNPGPLSANNQIGRSNWWIITFGTISGLLLLGGERLISFRRQG